MPGAVADTATWALTQATLPCLLTLANEGYRAAVTRHPGLRSGLNVCLGAVTNRAVAEDLGFDYCDPELAVEGPSLD